MKCRYQGRVFARVEEVDVNDLGIRWLQTGSRVDRILNVDLPLNPWFECIRDLASCCGVLARRGD